MKQEHCIDLIITQEDREEFKRLDTYLAKKLPDLSRSLIRKFFEQKHFICDIQIELKKMPPAKTHIKFMPPVPKPMEISPQNIPLDILFEDEHLIIINKAAGMVVHPAPGNPDGTLVNAILHHCKDLQGIGNEQRPGIVHRLDKGTTGIMVVAKNQKTHEGLVTLFSSHDIERKYEAICLGARLPSQKLLESTIGRSPRNRLKMEINVKNGKTAITHLTTQEQFKSFAHVELKLETGRTHQIRVHLSQVLNAPILNDQTYGKTKQEKHLLSHQLKKIIAEYEHPFLHAKQLGFIHPITQEKHLFEKTAPPLFQEVLTRLQKETYESYF